MSDICHFPGCGKPAFVKQTIHGQLCDGHYAQFRRGKDLTALRGYRYQGSTVDPTRDKCPYPDCNRPSWHKHGYCQTHQRQLWTAKGDEKQLAPIRNHQQQTDKQCQEDGCNRPAKARGYCSKHYRQDWGNCDLPGCGRKKHNKKTGYCSKHYAKARKLGSHTMPQSDEQEV